MNTIFLMLLSLFLFAGSIYSYRKTQLSKITRFFFSALIFISILLYLFYGISDYFTGEGINNDVIYTLQYGLKGAGFLEYSRLIITSIIILIGGLIFSVYLFLKKVKNLLKLPVK